jgi:membrane protein
MKTNAKSRFANAGEQRTRFARIIRPGRFVIRFFWLVKLAIWRAFDHDAYDIAKASAYSCILSFFPALLVLGAVLASSQHFEAYLHEISYVLGRVLPVGSNAAIHYLRSNDDRPVGFLVSTSLLTVWLASGVVVSLMKGFRYAYQLPTIWRFVKERAIACALVILAGIPMIVATILIAFGGQIENWAMVLIGHRLGPLILLMGTGIRWIVAILTSVAVITVIYHNAVPRTQRWHRVLPGASLATAMWLGATVLFGWYVNRSTEYSEIYGSLAVGIALLIWMFLISLIVLVGAEFNALLFPRSIPQRPLAIEGKSHWKTAA